MVSQISYIKLGMDSVEYTRFKNPSKSLLTFQNYLEVCKKKLESDEKITTSPVAIFNLYKPNILKENKYVDLEFFKKEIDLYYSYYLNPDSIKALKKTGINTQKSTKEVTNSNVVKTAYGLVSYNYLDNYFNSNSKYPHSTQFTYIDINYVSPKIEQFVSDKLNLCRVSELDKYDFTDFDKIIEYNYKTCIGVGKPKTLLIRFVVFAHENNLIIKKVIIKGFDEYVLQFFIKFWYTKLNFDTVREGEIVSNFFLQDKVFLVRNKDLTIDIESSTIKSQEEFNKIIQ